jgi:very-short-patch-repair endonuclease
MGVKINLNEDLIIKEYLSGKSSLTLAEEFGVSKPTILKILKENNVTRKRDRCKSLDIKKVDERYSIERCCPKCGNTVTVTSNNPTIACRNYFNSINKKSLCKKCSLDHQIGEGNSFYGKKHTKETKEQISKSRKGKAMGENNSMANPDHRKKARDGFIERIKKTPIKYNNRSKKEKEIFKTIKKNYKNAKHSFVVDNFICDIFIPSKNLIVEYNGDYWHCNPIKYDGDYFHKIKNKTAKEIWEYDKNRIDLLTQKGYNLEVIWEYDFNKDPNLINELLKKYD